MASRRRSWGQSELLLTVAESNAAAIALYTRCGFRTTTATARRSGSSLSRAWGQAGMVCMRKDLCTPLQLITDVLMALR
eukprot:5103570-Pleurochrysis_carterae.AAC.1